MKRINRLLVFLLVLSGWVGTSALTAPTYRDMLSNLHVSAFAQDRLGFMWIATSNGLCRSDGRGYQIYFYNEKDRNTISSNSVTGLFIDSHGRLWASTGNGVSRMNDDHLTFSRYSMASAPVEGFCLGFFECRGNIYTYGYNGLYKINEQKGILESKLRLDGQVITDGLVDKDKNVWLVNGSELIKLSSTMRLIAKYEPDRQNVLNCIVSAGGSVLVGTRHGIMTLDTRAMHCSADMFPAAMSALNISVIRQINPRLLLLGTGNRGVVFYDLVTHKLLSREEAGIFENVESPEITSAFVDRSRNIWLGTFDKGFYLKSQKKDIFNMDRSLVDFMRNKFVTRVIGDRAGNNLWIGTRYNGFYCYNIRTRNFRNYNSLTLAALHSFSSDFVQEMFFDSIGRLWIGYGNSLIVCAVNGAGGISVEKRYDNLGNIVTIAEDSSHQVWAGSSDNGFFLFGADLTLKRHFTSSVANSNNITKVIPLSPSKLLFSAYMDNIYLLDIHTASVSALDPNHQSEWRNAVELMRDSRGNMWIGTYGNGLLQYNLHSRSLRKYTTDNGLLSNDIIAMEEDSRHNIWASSSYGLYRLNPLSHRINTYLKYDGTGGDQYHEKCVYKAASGNIYFGGNNGLEEIVPGNVSYTSKGIPLYLTDLKLYNKSVVPGDESGLLEKDISITREIELSYNQNAISLDFVGLCYDYPEHLIYAYRLKGFDKTWNFVGKYNRASYSNLPQGEYEFEVKVQNGDGDWSTATSLLTIKVNPAPWLHPIAIMLYVALFIWLLYYGNKIYLRLKLSQERYAMAETQVEHERTMAQMKVNFFTNISHELRTPLTMIYGPVQQLTEYCDKFNDSKVSSNLDFIGKNVERLLSLLNQLLDFGKIKDETLPLMVAKYDCVQQLTNIVKIYKIYAGEKRQSVDFVCTYDKLVATYDSDKLDKIMNNLLFNATKYTPNGGDVKVKMELTKHVTGIVNDKDWTFMQVSVIDTGIGISRNMMGELFGRFKRLLSAVDKEKINGSGVGLNYVYHLVANHKGYIKATKNAGKGMTFTFWIPIDDDAYTEAERVIEHEVKSDVQDSQDIDGGDNVTEKEENERKRILVVEDNDDMCAFVKNLLKDSYDVATAADGVEGLQRAHDESPDLIISDVMMPRMDGYELCSRVKNDKDICHIPVILLTAKTMDADQIEGYNRGADMYVNKPFNPDVLQSMVNSLIMKIERQKNILVSASGKEGERDEVMEQELSPLDQRFMTKLYKYIDDNLSDSELNVGLLGSELGFSRTNFYRKIKALAGMTPNDFLRVYRLNKAAQLIRMREYPLSEISEMTGFGTQSHFSHCFKKHFGVSPKDFLSNDKKQV